VSKTLNAGASNAEERDATLNKKMVTQEPRVRNYGGRGQEKREKKKRNCEFKLTHHHVVGSRMGPGNPGGGGWENGSGETAKGQPTHSRKSNEKSS